MSLMEQKNKIDLLGSIGNKLASVYELRKFGKRSCFVNLKGIPFNLFAFPGEPALCVEYAENADEAAIGRFEDGDLFYLQDYETETLLLEAIMEEIAAAK